MSSERRRSRLERNQQPECIKSTGPVALHSRPVFCVFFRLVYDPLPIPVGLLPRRNLHRLVGVSLDVADHELLGLDLLHLPVSQTLLLGTSDPLEIGNQWRSRDQVRFGDAASGVRSGHGSIRLPKSHRHSQRSRPSEILSVPYMTRINDRPRDGASVACGVL